MASNTFKSENVGVRPTSSQRSSRFWPTFLFLLAVAILFVLAVGISTLWQYYKNWQPGTPVGSFQPTVVATPKPEATSQAWSLPSIPTIKNFHIPPLPIPKVAEPSEADKDVGMQHMVCENGDCVKVAYCTAVGGDCASMELGKPANYGTGSHTDLDGRTRPNPPAGSASGDGHITWQQCPGNKLKLRALKYTANGVTEIQSCD